MTRIYIFLAFLVMFVLQASSRDYKTHSRLRKLYNLKVIRAEYWILKMVQPTILTKRNSLRGIKLLHVIKKIKGGKPDALKEFARVSKEKKTENLEFEEIEMQVNSITGESMAELLELAGRDATLEEARWALHCVSIFANEVGQPRGQVMEDSMVPRTSTSTGSEGVSPDSAGPSVAKKRKQDDTCTTLENRVLSLEKTEKVEMVKDLKEKVRTLCLQEDPSNALILLTLDELAKVARKISHEEADMFEELY